VALPGRDAPGLSANTITRLKADWWEDYDRWSRRDLSERHHVYFWADGVCFTPGMDGDRQCMLVSIGADEWGDKDVPGLVDGFRESPQSWRELLVDLKHRVGWTWHRNWPQAMVPRASGQRCMRFTARPAFSGAGFTKRPTF
jgi:hypothetical protein